MAHVNSVVWPIDSAATGGSGGEGDGSEERTMSTEPSNAGSHSNGGDVRVKSSHLHSFCFRPSTVTVSRIYWMIDNGYFADGMGREPREETVPEPHIDEAMLYEEFFTASLQMPPHPVLAAILLKYQIPIHQLTPIVIVQLSKYIWAVTSLGGVPSAEGFAKRIHGMRAFSAIGEIQAGSSCCRGDTCVETVSP
jgi:hypothetical protein